MRKNTLHRRNRAQILRAALIEALEPRTLLTGIPVSVSDAQLVQGTSGTALVFTVTRSGDLNTEFSLFYSTGGGTAVAGVDYVETYGILNFQPQADRLTVAVPVIANTTFEGDRTVGLHVAVPPYGAAATHELPSHFDVGRVGAAVVADVDNDGKPDVATVTKGSGVVSLARQSVHYFVSNAAASYQSQGVTAGDFNGDGKIDLVTANVGDMSFLNGASPSLFSLNTSFDNDGGNHTAVVAGDFNGDTKLDLVVSDATAGTVSVLLGNGNGTFQPPVVVRTGSQTSYLLVRDLNGDGKPDVVASGDGGVDVMLGTGTGGFQPAATYLAGQHAVSVAAGDVDGDGKIDLVTARRDASGTVSLLRGVGDGTFLPEVTIAGPAQAAAVAIGDFNADGKLDVAAAAGAAGVQGTVSILIGNNNGTFQPAVVIAAGIDPLTMVAGDLNGDAKTDLAVTNYGSHDLNIIASQPAGITLTRDAGVGTIVEDDAPTALTVALGSNTTATANPGAVFATVFSVRVTNAQGEGVANTAVTFTAPAAGASGDFSGHGPVVTVATNVQGVATAPLLIANGLTGSYQVTATVADGSVAPLVFTLANTAAAATYSAAEYFPLQGAAGWSFAGSQVLDGQITNFTDIRSSHRTSVTGTPVTRIDDPTNVGFRQRRYFGYDPAHGVRLYFVDNFPGDTDTHVEDYQDAPLPVLSPTLTVGRAQSWANTRFAFYIDGKSVHGISSGTSTVNGVELVDLPGGLGTVAVLRVTFDHTESYTLTVNGAPLTVTRHTNDVMLLVRGVGMVKESVFVDTRSRLGASAVATFLVLNAPPVLATPPVTPTNVEAVVSAPATVSVTWNFPIDKTQPGAYVQRWDGTQWVTRAVFEPGMQNYIDTGLTPGATYYYQVVSVNDAGTTPAAGYVTVTVPGFTPPDPATNLTATPVGHASVVVSWNPTFDATGERVRGILVARFNGTNWQFIAMLPANSNGFTDTNLNGPGLYSYHVVQFNEYGWTWADAYTSTLVV